MEVGCGGHRKDGDGVDGGRRQWKNERKMERVEVWIRLYASQGEGRSCYYRKEENDGGGCAGGGGRGEWEKLKKNRDSRSMTVCCLRPKGKVLLLKGKKKVLALVAVIA